MRQPGLSQDGLLDSLWFYRYLAPEESVSKFQGDAAEHVKKCQVKRERDTVFLEILSVGHRIESHSS